MGTHKDYREPKRHLFRLEYKRFIVPGSEEATRLEMARVVEATRDLRVKMARADFCAFMEYCFFDEATRRPFLQQWFHDEWSEAWTANDRVIIVAPRDHGKTSQIVGRVIWELGKNPNLRIKIACAADGRAKERLFEVVQHIEHNRRVHEVFPHLKQDKHAEWSKHKIIVERTALHRDASVEALGITSTATGGRCDLLIADDVVDRRNALTAPKLREQIKQAWKSDWTNLLEPNSRIWYICTLWHKDDLSHELMENKAFKTLFYAVDQSFGALWPTKWSTEALQLRHAEIGSVEFNRAFRNQALDESTQLVQHKWIKFADLGKLEVFNERSDDLQYFTSYDTAKATSAGSDYTSGCVIAVDTKEGHVYIVDAWHARISLKQQSRNVWKEYCTFQPFRILIESVGLAALDEWAINDHPELEGRIEVTKPRVSKAQRLLAVTPLMEAGRVTFAKHLDPDGLSWDPSRGSLVHELQDFPIGKHDDMVDSFSQSLAAARRYFLDTWAPNGEDCELKINVGVETDSGDMPKYLF